MKTPLITVLVTTYNHEKYLADCLDGILMQDYPNFKIVVGEDRSPDSTAMVLRKYTEKYPDKIIPVFREKNIGGHANFEDCLKICESEWIAWIEGDDFWIDKSKLSKQMALLQANSNGVVCFSKANSIDTSKIGFIENKVFGPAENFIKKNYTRDDLLRGNFMHTCTLVFKKSKVWPLPEWYNKWHLGDWTLVLEALKHGDALFLNEVTATYRIHGGGVWSSTSFEKKLTQQENLINFLIEIEKSKQGKKNLYFNLLAQQLGLFVIFLNKKQYKIAFSKICSAVRTAFHSDWSWTQFQAYASKGLKLFIFLKKKSRPA